MKIALEQIHTHRQARELFQGIDSLAGSIAALGQLTPLIVREIVAGQRYDLIAGERRLRALRQLQALDPAKWQSAECTVIPASVSLTDALSIQLAENIERRALRVWEIGNGVRELKKWGQPLELIAPRIGMTVSATRRAAAISEGLAPATLAALALLPEHAVSVSRLLNISRLRDEIGNPDPDRQLEWLRKPPGKPPAGTYDRGLERRVVTAKINALELDLLPTLPAEPQRVVRAVLAYLRRGGKIKPFRWEDFNNGD